MKFKNVKKQKETIAEVGDFIFAGEMLMLIIRDDCEYKTFVLKGYDAFNGFGLTRKSIEDLVTCYKSLYSNFELIKSNEITLVRG